MLEAGRFDVVEVETDSSELNSKLLQSYVPFKVKTHFNPKTESFDMIIDGNDFEFYMVTGRVQFDAIQKKIVIRNV